MNYLKVIYSENLSPDFEYAPFWSAPFENLNSSGYSFEPQPEETDSDVLLYVVEHEEDNRDMKGGNFSQWGTVYGISFDAYSEFYGNPLDNGFEAVGQKYTAISPSGKVLGTFTNQGVALSVANTKEGIGIVIEGTPDENFLMAAESNYCVEIDNGEGRGIKQFWNNYWEQVKNLNRCYENYKDVVAVKIATESYWECAGDFQWSDTTVGIFIASSEEEARQKFEAQFKNPCVKAIPAKVSPHGLITVYDTPWFG